jgi:nicotinate-nucleotide pyrophosphorylase (carboxylating)
MKIPDFVIRKKILEFLEEDLYYGDVTGCDERIVRAELVTKEKCVIAGVRVAKIAFETFGVQICNYVPDGVRVAENTGVMEIEGDASDILTLERTVLNILMRMSGIATATAIMVERARRVNPSVRIAATRKTTPGFRVFEKMAVQIGGGDTHRMGLGDCVMIKDNHIAIAGDILNAIEIARMASFTKKIVVEVRDIREALTAAKKGADVIMLDNFDVDEVKLVLEMLEKENLRENVIVEVSGGITPENVQRFAETGVDVISSGYITHSARAIDMSLNVKP